MRRLWKNRRGSLTLDYVIAISIFLAIGIYAIGQAADAVRTSSFQTQTGTLSTPANQFARIILDDPGVPPDWSDISEPERPSLGLYDSNLYNNTLGRGYSVIDENKTTRLSPSGRSYIPYSIGDSNYDGSYHTISPSSYNFRKAFGLDSTGQNFRLVISPIFCVTINTGGSPGQVDSVTVTVTEGSGKPVDNTSVYIEIIGCDGFLYPTDSYGNPAPKSLTTGSDGKCQWNFGKLTGVANGQYVVLVLASKGSLYGWSSVFFTYTGGSSTWNEKFGVRAITCRNGYLKATAEVNVVNGNPDNVYFFYFKPDSTFSKLKLDKQSSGWSKEFNVPLDGPYTGVILAYTPSGKNYGYAASSYPMMVEYGSQLRPQANYVLVTRIVIMHGTICRALIYFWA